MGFHRKLNNPIGNFSRFNPPMHIQQKTGSMSVKFIGELGIGYGSKISTKKKLTIVDRE